MTGVTPLQNWATAGRAHGGGSLIAGRPAAALIAQCVNVSGWWPSIRNATSCPVKSGPDGRLTATVYIRDLNNFQKKILKILLMPPHYAVAVVFVTVL